MYIFKKIIILIELLLTAFAVFPAHAELVNTLANNPSPYLAMHGKDPVKWQPWGQSAIETARRENKLLFISVGYFSCYWCHVMQRESYQNTDIAKILNKYFIPVVVDRELNPALDAHLINFVEQYSGSAGWPLNVFVTPEGYPLLGSLYQPPKEFLALLVKLVDRWQLENEKLQRMAAQAAMAEKPAPVSFNPSLENNLGKQLEILLIKQAMEQADQTAGGFGEQSKFPMTPVLQTLLDSYHRTKDKQLGEFLTLTLQQMSSQGLRDHLGGGFFRYTVDPTWQTPHFEKMLYDNALLASLYLHASKVLNRPDFATIAQDTLKFMIRELVSPDGGMYSSLSAVDDKGTEGAYYLWQEDELKQLLSQKQYNVIQLAWKLGGASPYEGGYLPLDTSNADEITARLRMNKDEVTNLLTQAKSKLSAARNRRQVPIDTKQLAGWNGLALVAISQSLQLNENAEIRSTGKQLRDYLINELWDGRHLLRAKNKAGPIGDGGLEDYAYVAAGLVSWANINKDEHDYKLAKTIVEQAWQRFYQSAGWRLSDNMLLPIETGQVALDDQALPSPSATLIDVSIQLAKKYKDKTLENKALSALNSASVLLKSYPFSFATTVATISYYQTNQLSD